MPGTELPFDIRNYVPGAERDNDYIQAGYDTINRMVALIGDISFLELFGQELGEIATRLTSKVPLAAQFGLIKHPDVVLDLLCSLSQVNLSLQQLIDNGYDETFQGVYDTIQDLWRQGIYFPKPTGYAGKDAKLQKALRGLLEQAGNFSYQQLFDTAAKDLPQATLNAIQRSNRGGVIFLSGNGRCCSCDDAGVCGCTPGNPNDNCTMIPGTNSCTSTSTKCSIGGSPIPKPAAP